MPPAANKLDDDDAAQFRFTYDWFTEHAWAWNILLTPRFADKPDVHALFVGPFEGRCVSWLLQHILTGPRCGATIAWDIDPGTPPQQEARVLRRLQHNIGVMARRFGIEVAMAARPDKPRDAVLLDLRHQQQRFDIVYVDATSSRMALETCVLAFPLLKPGGVLIVTNNTHGPAHDAACPRRGIDGFLDAYVSEAKVLRQGFHVFVERRTVPYALPHSCESEYFHGDDVRPRAAKSKSKVRVSSPRVRSSGPRA